MKCPKCQLDNPETSRFCGECGTQLQPTRGHEPNSQEFGVVSPKLPTETLQMPARELTTGSTFAGRYQVIEELGHGGMGRVYKVQDTDIKEKVALKLLRPEITLDKEAVVRFSNELKLARKISHRNVCRMFDLGRAEGTTFITMEFVPGEDLKSFIHRAKQLSIGTAISIARQVCEGLEEAHRLGVVHRDLKPGNIMIDKDGDAKIMDFGIARSLSGRGITGAGVLIGTPEYMSPEQVEGKDIDQRSDIYSLGVILYEMVTGRQPFAGDTPLSIAHKHKYEAPEDPKKLNTQVSDDLARVILKCLAKDRNERFQSAAELGTELGRIEQGLPTTDQVIRKKRALTSKEITVKFRLTKVLAPASVFVVLVLAGIILWRVIPSRKPALSHSASGQPTLAVLYFENKSGDANLDNWRDGLAELAIGALSQSRYLRVITGDEMYTILKRLGLADSRKYSSEDIQRIAAQCRATHVLRGTYIKAGKSLIISAGLQTPGTDEGPIALRLEARTEDEIPSKVDELTRRVKEGLNLTAAQLANDIEKEAGKITTSSPEALKYYVEGRKHQNRGEYTEAIGCLEKAIQLDPQFAMAYASMARAQHYSGKILEGRKYRSKALEFSGRLPDNEKLLIEADISYFDEDYAKTIEIMDKLLKTYPNHIAGHHRLAHAYLWVDIDKAIEHFELVAQNLRTPQSVNNLAGTLMMKGLYQKAEDVCKSYLREVEDNSGTHRLLSYCYVLQREFDRALAEEDIIRSAGPSGNEFTGDILAFKDDIGAAETVYRKIYETNRDLGLDRFLRLDLIRGRYVEAIDFLQKYFSASNEETIIATNVDFTIGAVLEFAGRYEEASQIYDRYFKLRADHRKSAPESSLPYLPSDQKGDLFTKARIQAEMKNWNGAAKAAEELKGVIEKGISVNELPFYDYVLGLIELGKKNPRKAAVYFEKACGRLYSEFFPVVELAQNGDQAFFLNGLALALFEAGDLDRARAAYERITRLTIGRWNEGDIYSKAFYMLGKIAEQQGDKTRARENYAKFLDLWKDADPGLPEVEDAKNRLKALF